MARKAKSKRYVTQLTEMASNADNRCDDQRLKNKIYNRFIHYPFDKLAENVIHTYKTYYFDVPYEDVKMNVVAFLNEKIHKFNGDNGRAFSYFTVIARNYLFNENNQNYARMKAQTDVDSIDNERDVVNETYIAQNLEFQSDFMDFFGDYMDFHIRRLFPKERDQKIADSLNELFKHRDNLYSYNKKALYILIRERTGVSTQYITKIVGRYKVIYAELYSDYSKGTIKNLNHRIEEFNA